MDGLQKTIPGAAFYDAVATEYNSHMTDNDRKARAIISKAFVAQVKSGNVLDFGGGTGLDLPWLAANKHYHVFFLETSAGMRAVAKQNMQSTGNIRFMEDYIDFNDWTAANLPFPEKMDGILANFAVLNSIQNLDAFFENISMICNHGCRLFLTVLDSRLPAVFKRYPLKTSLKYITQKKLAITNNYNDVKHTTYIHALSALKAASKNQFNYISYSPVPFSNFALLILSKN
jgi:SAM-dependent methyltransferase